MEKSDQPNRAVDKEHPGPPPPDTSSGKSSSSKSSSKSTSTSHSSQSGGDQNREASSGQDGGQTKDGRKPAIYQPGPAPENQSEEVREHNEEVSRRYERTGNQIGSDHKVEKDYWKGTLGLFIDTSFTTLPISSRVRVVVLSGNSY